MPLFARAVLAYLLALIVALSGGLAWADSRALPASGSAALIVAATVAAILLVHRRPRWRPSHRAVVGAGIVGASLAGLLAGTVARQSDAICLARESAATSWRVVLTGDAKPGAPVSGTLRECGLAARLVVVAGHAHAGDEVEVRGNVLRAAGMLVVDGARIAVRAGPGWRERARARLSSAAARTFPRDSALARALLVADASQLDRAVRDEFAAAGLAHVLAISGMHVGILALAIELLVMLVGAPRPLAAPTSATICAVYVLVIGAPPSAVRAAVMLGVRAVARMMQRPTSPWIVLALGSLEPLVHPRVVVDAGFQLSVIGVASLTCASELVKRYDRARQRRRDPARSGYGVEPPSWRRTLVVAFAGSVIASVAATPLVAWRFGRVSFVGPIASVAAAPLIAVAQPALFAGLATSQLHWLSAVFADGAHPLLVALERVAALAAAAPGAGLTATPSTGEAMLLGVAAVAAMVAAASGRTRGPLVAASLALGALAARAPGAGDGYTELHMIDVGQGDAVALRTPHGHWVLVDAGPGWRGGDAGQRTVVPYIAHAGGPLDAFVLSHPHTDHVGGAVSVIRALRPGLYIDDGFAGPAPAYRASLVAAGESGTHWWRAHPGDSLVVDGVVLHVLAPDSAWTAGLTDPNLASTTVLVQAGAIRFLLVGDAEAPEERWLVARWGDSLHADVLKVGHHGSRTSSTQEFLDRVRPRVALVSVGAGNHYGLPDEDVLARLAATGARVLRTDAWGTIVARTDGRRLWLHPAPFDIDWEVPSSGDSPGR